MSTELQPLRPTEPESGWMRIIGQFIEKGNTVEQLERLFQLQQQWEHEQARKAFVAAFAAFKAEAPTNIDRTGHVGFKTNAGPVEYSHVELHRATQALVPAMSNHGLSHAWKVDQADSGLITVTCTLSHIDGHSEAVTLRGMPDKSGSKNDIQAVGSAVYYLERYTFLAVLGIAQGEDNDGRLGNGELSTADEQAKVREQLKRLDKQEDSIYFRKWLKEICGAEKVSEIPKSEVGKVIDVLSRMKPKNTNGKEAAPKAEPTYVPDPYHDQATPEYHEHGPEPMDQ